MKPVEDIIRECAHGHSDAHEFLLAFYAFVHAVDDVFDHDTLVSDEGFAMVCMHFVTAVGGNPFYQQHRQALEALTLASVSAWIDANAMEKVGNPQGLVLKSLYHEVFWHVAYIVGGWPHMREMSTAYRQFKTKEQDGIMRISTSAT